jgi:hypothetical protein
LGAASNKSDSREVRAKQMTLEPNREFVNGDDKKIGRKGTAERSLFGFGN